MCSLRRTFIIGTLLFVFWMPLRAAALGNASIYLAPSSGNYAKGVTFSVVVRVNTGGDSINAAEGSLVFDPAKLEVRSISKGGSIFTLWTTEPTFSNPEGTIEFGGGLPNPGYSGSNGLILTITFFTKGVTTVRNATQVVLVSGAVLANDGYGTNILTSLGKGSYYIGPGVFEPTEPSDTTAPAVNNSQAPQVTSKTHPDQALWYRNNDPEFSWTLGNGVDGVSYLITERPTSNPGNTSDGLKDTVSFTDVTDGTHYFHIKFRRQGAWGPIQHFKFNIDTVPPAAFTVSVPEDAQAGARPTVLFTTTDALSGVDHYTVRINDGKETVVAPAMAGKPYVLPNLFAGTHTITVVALDGAGNGTLAQAQIKTQGINRPRIAEAPRRVESGVAFTVRGIAPAHSEVVAYFESLQATEAQIINDPRIVKSVTTTADATGAWVAEVTDIPDGVYRVQAYVQYPDGSISLSSDPETMRIGGLMFGSMFGWLADFFGFLARMQERWLVPSIILYTLLGLLLAHYLLPRATKAGKSFLSFQKKVRAARDLQQDEHQLVKRLVGLHVEITKELKLLQGIGKHRALYPDERYLRTKLLEYQKALKPTAPRKRSRKK